MRGTLKSKGLAVLTAVFLLFLCGVVLAAHDDRYEEKFEKTEALAKDGRVFISNISGNIEIRTWNEDKVKIDALKISEASSEEKARENAGRVTIEVTREGSLLRIETKYPRERRFWGERSLNVSVDYKLWVPVKAAVEAKSVSGDVLGESMGGALKVESVSGDVDIQGAGSGVDVGVVSGDVTVLDITGDAYIKTVSGTVQAERVKGSVEAENVSGDIELRDISEARVVTAKTVSGDVEYQGKINPQGRYTLKSHSGDVTAILPADAAFELDAETFSGVIDSEFSIEVMGKISPKEVHGTVNKGGATLRVSAFSGNVEIKKG